MIKLVKSLSEVKFFNPILPKSILIRSRSEPAFTYTVYIVDGGVMTWDDRGHVWVVSCDASQDECLEELRTYMQSLAIGAL